MANNRLWLVDTATGERVLLAKSNGSGWWLYDPDGLAHWLARENEDGLPRDSGASLAGGSLATGLKLVDENHED